MTALVINNELGLQATGETSEVADWDVSGMQLPGWYLLAANDDRLTDAAFLARLSKGRTVVAAFIEEHVMVSYSQQWENGVLVWEVTHDAQTGIYHLEQQGTPPASLKTLHETYRKKQDAEGGDKADVDFMFEVPLELARQIVGFKHDEVRDDELEFEELKVTRPFTTRSVLDVPRRKSLFGRLFR